MTSWGSMLVLSIQMTRWARWRSRTAKAIRVNILHHVDIQTQEQTNHDDMFWIEKALIEKLCKYSLHLWWHDFCVLQIAISHLKHTIKKQTSAQVLCRARHLPFHLRDGRGEVPRGLPKVPYFSIVFFDLSLITSELREEATASWGKGTPALCRWCSVWILLEKLSSESWRIEWMLYGML